MTLTASLRKWTYIGRHLGWVLRHPLNRDQPLRTLGRFVGWHLGSRLLAAPVLYPFVNDLQIHVGAGFWGATGVVHFGLEEYEDMAFCAHLMRPGDLFVDVGACYGTYTLLAGGVGGADCLSFEPCPPTARWLRENVRLNRLEQRVEVRTSAVGSRSGTVQFTQHLQAANHILSTADGAAGTYAEVPLTTLDEALAGRSPTMLKIDVEGYEDDVLQGATAALGSENLLAVLVEDVGLGRRYHQGSGVHERLLDLGFRSYSYEPEMRRLVDLNGGRSTSSGNTLYLRDIDQVRRRVAEAAPLSVRGRSL